MFKNPNNACNTWLELDKFTKLLSIEVICMRSQIEQWL